MYCAVYTVQYTHIVYLVTIYIVHNKVYRHVYTYIQCIELPLLLVEHTHYRDMGLRL